MFIYKRKVTHLDESIKKNKDSNVDTNLEKSVCLPDHANPKM